MANHLDIAIKFFYEEAEEHIGTLERGLLCLDQDPESARSLIDEMFRAAHTLKGSAGLVKLKTISQIAHKLEDSLEGIRDNRAEASRERIDFMLFALDHIRELTHLAAAGQKEPEGVLDQVDSLRRAAESAPILNATEKTTGPAQPGLGEVSPPALSDPQDRQETETFTGIERRTPPREESATGLASGVIRVGTDKLESMMNLLGEITVVKTHLVSQLAVMQRIQEEVEFAGQRLLREVGNFSDRYAYAMPEQVRYTDALTGEFQELEFDRYDELNLFSRKLQEATSDIGEGLRGMTNFFAGFTGEVETMDRMVVEMKERLSEARTVRAESLFQRFTRTIRELSRESGKKLNLIVAGGETLIDRVVFDGLYDPLLHIVRNAVAHGFEPEDVRKRQGKPGPGNIWMTARRKGSTVEIEIRDDGRGIQLDKVRKRAREKGFMGVDEQLSDQDLLQMIFRPGFSTAEVADSTSGRGVGMNVVMDRLAALNGTIQIFSEPGQGTTIQLTLPLSLVIINVIQYRCSGQAFVIPTNLVEEIIDLPRGQIAPEQLTRDGQSIPTVDLNRVFGLAAAEQKAGTEEEQRFAIIVQTTGKSAALLVDAIVSQEDTVIKPFGSFLRGIPFLSGSSISGDGSLRLVVNPARILDALDLPAQIPVPVTSARRKTRVMIVDDSLSVRKYASMILQAHNFEVVTATQGLEALEILDHTEVDLLITDLEMPVMHGFELLGELGRRNRLQTLPTIVLSSRAGQQHRDKALALGACDYLIKPFEEETLVGTVRRHLIPK